MTSLSQLSFENSHLPALGVAAAGVGLLAVVLVYTVGLRGRRHSLFVRLALLTLRLGAGACLVMALLRPVWVNRDERDVRPIVAVVLDDSESMSRPLDGDGGVSRYDAAMSFVDDRLAPAVTAQHRMQLFDVEGRWLSDGDAPDEAAGAQSPLTAAMLRVQRDLADQPLVGIVLLSDGAERSDRPTHGGIEQLRVPVYPVDLAAASGNTSGGGGRHTDVVIENVTTNRRVIAGNTVKAYVDVRATGPLPESGVTVHLMDGRRIVASQLVRLTDREPAVRAEMEFTPRRPGRYTYHVQAKPIEGEANLANNRAPFPLNVIDDQLNILYIDGVLRWEGKFTRQALADDPDVNLISSVRIAPRGTDCGSQGLLLPEHLTDLDVVIIGDVEAAFFSGAEMDALANWITDDGGGLLITGGYHSFGPQGLARTGLNPILPVMFSADPNPQIEQSFSMRLTPAGQASPIFALTGDRVRDTAFYQSLPPLAGCSRIAGIKSGAQVLAINPTVAGPGESEGLPVMVVQQVGKGRTMVFAVDTTWRWRMVIAGFTGDAGFYETFWSQLVRYLAGREEKKAEVELVVTTDRTRYKVSETIELKAALSGDSPDQHVVTAMALDEKGTPLRISLTRDAEHNYRGTLAANAPGRLDLIVRAERTATADRDLPATISRFTTLTIDRPDLEMLDPNPDPQWLIRTARLSGGQMIEPDDVDAWARQLPAQPVKSTMIETTALWHHPLLATLFFILICAEWILRRYTRLA